MKKIDILREAQDARDRVRKFFIKEGVVNRANTAHDLIVEMYAARKKRREAKKALYAAINAYDDECHCREDYDSAIENDEACGIASDILEKAKKEAARATTAVRRYGEKYQ